ncbi:MAG TPA: GYF domain-containing protein [Kofleriaceae bacterium]|nr:GYF domain-containing protein [Kofleriaceae bacterium]
MKFLCDKCKTRYSIGEDRVRGKILKIRCKNCANVITVREGMDGAEVPGDRPRTPTGGQPAVSAAPAGGGALGAAFQSQMASSKPPPALEEEWYVSIDGVQSGPLSLTDAQKWVSAKPFDAELHCWSEGFDDWLPVDKVSHFRGLRKAPPPMPSLPPKRPSGKTVPPPIPEKPLFAATMASIEKSASQPNLPTLTSPSTKPGMPAVPAITSQSPGSGGIKTNGKPVVGQQPLSAGAAALAQAFAPDPSDSMTSVGSPAFESEPIPPASGPNDPFFNAVAAAKNDPFAERDPFAAKGEAKKPVVPIHNDDDDNLEIGEVSRVVNLKDLAQKPKPIAKTPTAGFDRISGTGSVPRIGGGTASNPRVSASNARIGGLTGSSPKLSPSELGMNVDPALASQLTGAAGEPHASESVVAQSFKERHRRGLMALIGVSAIMVVGVVLLFVFVVNNNNETYEGGLGGTHQIDTSRPEDIVRKQLPPVPNAGSNAVIANNATKKWLPRNNNLTTNNGAQEEVGGNALKASEVEDMAAKQGEGTKRCYMRAQKGALGFEIQDVKKIAVTLSVNKDGSVNSVQLSEHANDTFGQCLIARIKAWKFRESGGGTFRISLAFSNS